ncbi:DJ-1/PfpI family protein [Paracoccus versutus]|uniref:DJ-1/PfpI family protein n=1 Tax=Paracoccus versutus TaxID=34007 RepID=UPI001FB5D31B|nr:DJ-1/PfpI family protein [Paracoccus versutus]
MVAMWGLIGAVIVVAGGFGLWLAALPSDMAASAPPVPASETAAMLDALQPSRKRRPVIAVIGLNDATETTDYVVPTGILRRADVADVLMLAAGPGPVHLYPALNAVEPDATIAEFDAAHPDGADYVIVPAMSRDDDPAVLAWLRQQSDKGAIVIAVCAGAKVVGAAGLLDGRRATTHWYYLKDLLRRSPTIEYVAPALRDRRKRRDDHRHHRIRAHDADPDRGRRRPQKGRGRGPGSRRRPLGRAACEQRIQV